MNVIGLLANENNVIHDESVNLALRKTTHQLLKESGDSTSRIPAVEKVSKNKYRIEINQNFKYDRLSNILNDCLELYGIHAPYYVSIKKCENDLIDLGFHKIDIKSSEGVPCKGRIKPAGCHYLEITFTEQNKNKFPIILASGFFIFLLSAGLFYRYKFKTKNTTVPGIEEHMDKKNPTFIFFGNSKLDFDGLMLYVKDFKHNLTYREAKLLHYFTLNIGTLLTRDQLLKEVWESEGVLVGRSLDVFVSRLRKKLSTDDSLVISAIHGVGYKFEVKL